MAQDFYTIVSMLIFISPIVIGIAIFIALWAKEKFYETPLYDYEEDTAADA